MRPVRLALAVGTALGAFAGLTSGALGLWHDAGHVTVPAFNRGGVSFYAQPGTTGSAQRQYSAGGGAVSVTLPGSVIASVLDVDPRDPQPVFWRFQAAGFAQGIAGMVYDVAATEQVDTQGHHTSLASGVAAENTVLGRTRLKIYPAAASGDCSTVPATPAGESAKDVLVYGNDDHVLHAPGADTAGTTIVQTWCVAAQFKGKPDGYYANQVTASGTALDGTASTALSDWNSVVVYPATLDVTGHYKNDAFAEGTALDETKSRAKTTWEAELLPDPSREPSVTITLDPAVTNQNPNVVAPADTFALTP